MGFFSSWEPPWQVLLGQRGFFDQFTVTFYAGALGLVVEDAAVFDDRFGEELSRLDRPGPGSPPRFTP